MLLVDKVRFVLPKSREMQFPAMSVLQTFVAEFQDKCVATSVVPDHTPEYQLIYEAVICDEDWQFFESAGLKMKTPRVTRIEDPSMVVDLSEERVERYAHSGKHVGLVMGAMCGVVCPPLPKIRVVKPGRPEGRFRWGKFPGFDGRAPQYAEDVDGESLIGIQDGEWSGFIGVAGWETYLAASMGMPVIEVLPQGRPRAWLSKWTNRVYRMVDSRYPIQRQVDQAVVSIEDILEVTCSTAPADKVSV